MLKASDPHIQKLEKLARDVLIEHGAIKPNELWMSTLDIERYLERFPGRTGWVPGGGKWSISPRMKPLREKGLVETCKRPGLNTSGKLRPLYHHRAVLSPLEHELYKRRKENSPFNERSQLHEV